MSGNLQWFRLYHRIVDDEKVRLLAFEDRWHFVALCCLKCDGLLDEPDSDLKWRKVAVKMGVQARELDEIKRRLFGVGLVDENMQPVAWNELQFKSDTSTERVRKYREKTRGNETKRERNVSVTVQETESETDTSSLRSEVERAPKRASAASDLEEFKAELGELDPDRLKTFIKLRRQKRGTITGYAARLFRKDADACGLALADAVDICISRNWITVRPDWLAREGRAPPLAEANGTTATPEEWRKRLRLFVKRGAEHEFSWHRSWGAKPGNPDCECPLHILAEFGFRPPTKATA